MQTVTISKESYDKMIVGLSMVALAAANAKDGNVDVDAIKIALEAAEFPTT